MLRGPRGSFAPVSGAALAALVGLAFASGYAVSGTAADPATAMTGVVRVNGVTLALRSQLLEGEPDQLAARLAQRWGEPLEAPTHADSQGGRVRHRLGRQRGSFHETLSLSAGPRAGTSIALIAVQDLRRAPAQPAPPPFALPQGLRIVSVVEFGAGAAGAPRSYALDSGEPPAAALATVVAAAGKAGWEPLARPTPAAAWIRRGADELTAIAVRSGARTRVVLLLSPAREPRR